MAEGWGRVSGWARTVPTPVAVLGLLLALAALIGGALSWRFIAQERERELRGWQSRLAVVADSRMAAVNEWLARQQTAVTALAENASLQLYMTELSLGSGDAAQVTDEAAQAAYLRNLLVVTAEREGFSATPAGPQVEANVRRLGVAGLALVDAEGRILVATPGMPPLSGRLAELARSPADAERAVDGPYLGAAGQPTMAFFAPVLALQADPGAKRIGAVIGVKEIGRELFPLLARPPLPERTAESVLVRKSGAVIEYLSPLTDGTQAMERKIAADTPELAAAFAITSPGGFALRRDYRDVAVLATGRAGAGLGWTLLHKIDRDEALAQSDQRLNWLLTYFLLAIALALASIVAAWRHGASRRASLAATRFEELARRHEAQGRLLRLVTDNQPAALFIIDRLNRVRFTNRVAAARVDGKPEDLAGKTMAGIFGPASAKRYEALNQATLARGDSQTAVHRIDEGGALHVIKSTHVPVTVGLDEPPQVLVVEEDITDAVVERERRERIQAELVRALVTIVDRRDPHAAHHSRRVAAVARRIAEEMELDPAMIETAETAGQLFNIGKLTVPAEVLTKVEPLTAAEREQVRLSMRAGAELIAGVEFDGPVADTLRQVQERWDGQGVPDGRQGEDILISARIVAVANAFVALLSPRAWRPGVGFDKALDALLTEAGHAYDRRVVAALINDIENRGGRARWAEFADPAA